MARTGNTFRASPIKILIDMHDDNAQCQSLSFKRGVELMQRCVDKLDRIRSVLVLGFDAEWETNYLRSCGFTEIADAAECLIAALIDRPPRWKEAEIKATEIAEKGYGVCSELNAFRDELLHALLPLLFDLPTTTSAMLDALRNSDSREAHALAAARVLRQWPARFER